MIIATKNIRRGSITKILPWEKFIGIRTNLLKVVATLLRGLDALLVESNIWVAVLPVRMVFLNVVNKSTK